MADTVSAGQTQEAEIEVLQAIFASDFEVVESKTPWQTVNAVHEFRICVRPLEEDLKDRVSVKIHFKLPLRYPKAVPTMTLEEPEGLSTSLMTALHTSLVKTATSLLGAEMIYEICSKASENITDRHQANERGRQTSLGDQRKKRGEEEEKAMAVLQKQKNMKVEEARAAEASRLSMLISEEVRKKEEIMAERDKREIELGQDDLFEVLGDGDGWKVKMAVKTISDDEEAIVKLSPSTSSDWLGRVLPAEISIQKDPPFTGTALVFDILASYFTTTQGKRKLTKVTAALDHLRTLRHAHLQTFYGSLLCRYSPSIFPSTSVSNSKSTRLIVDGYTLIILKASPLSFEQTLEDLLLACGELRPDRAINYFTQLALALDFIHSSNVVHKGLRAKSVLIGMMEKGKSKTTGDVEVRLSEVGWRQMLVDLNKSDPWVVNADEEKPDSWISPEALEAPFVYDKCRDMWDLGVVFAQMLFGLDVCRRYNSPSDLLKNIVRSTSPAVRKILGDLLTDKKSRIPASRLTAYLSESSSSGSVALFLSSTPKNTVGWAQIPGAKQPIIPLFSPNQPISKSIDAQVGFFWQPKASGSRYKSEFEELEFLGRGGGGQVVKARNRLDLNLYAIKKIRLPNDKVNEQKILREVTIWSRMNHPNIVRYHTSWVETDEQPSYFDQDDSSTQRTGTDTETDDTSTSSEPSDFDRDEDSVPGHDLDIDLGLDDLIDVDFLSVGHSKSMSYPSIHFGNEDDESRPASTVANSPAMSRGATRTTSPAALKQVRTLYIQMEYVENLTLKEAIEEGITEVDSWRLMFQILSAMLHFTSLNIIHRDLKPSNIFIDVKGDVRIGDFGLAVNQGLADPADLLLSVDSLIDEAIDLTSGVGTSLYIAPESLSRGRVDRSIKYSNKIDMYSLGIVFFELWHPFKTGMERIQVLRDLRKPEIVFPSTWDAARLARHTKIMQVCLVHDPELRASPKDLLNSDLLPPRVGDDSIEETIRLLSHSGTTHAQTLITALFNQTAEDRLRKDFSYDFYDGEGVSLISCLKICTDFLNQAKVDNDPYGEIVREKLSRIFRQKGAVCMDSPLLMPHSQIYGSRSPVRLLDADGTIACLPFHLNIPFCRMVARDTSLTRLKRWTIAPVYRSSTAGGQPRAVLNAAFDIVSDAVTAATEAECLYVVEEVLSAFPFPGDTVHFLNHSKILDAVVEKVPTKRRSEVLEVLVQHGRLQRSWSKTAGELLKIQGVTKAMIDEIGTLDCAGDISEIRSRVLHNLPRLKDILEEGFDELEEIINLSTQLGVKSIKICPLLATNWDFHRSGVLFETHHIKGKTREAIATGGRFDDIVLRLAAPEVRFSGRCPHVVGFSMSVPKLSHAAADSNMTIGKALVSRKDEMTRSYGAWAVRRCDTYVVSFAPNLVEIRLDIVKDLWKAGMKADLMYDDNLLTLTPEQLVSACRREGILWLVIVKPGHERKILDDSERILKVKSVLRGWEEEVSRSELTGFLQKEMREQTIVDEAVIAGGASGSTYHHHHYHHHQIDPQVESSMTAAGDSSLKQSKQEIFSILVDEGSRQKGKYKQREIFSQKARKNVEQTAAASMEVPIFAIDVDGPAFKKMIQSSQWITDPSDESHLRIIQNISIPARRDYIRSVQVAIINYRDQHPGLLRIWLFSLRDDKSSLLTF